MLDTRPDEFDHRNLFLHALLGLISAGKKLDAALGSESPEAGLSITPADDNDDWLFCVLGMVSFHQRLHHHLGSVEAPPPSPPPALPKPTLALRGFLR